MRERWSDERGQAVVIVALAVVLLLGALALAIDWGYGLVQRRVMQTSADAAALAVGRYLATSVVQIEGGGTAFTVSMEQAWCAGERFIESNDPLRPYGSTVRLSLQFGNDASPADWTDAVEPAADCPAGGATPVPGDTIYVRATADITYHSLVSGILGFPTTTAAASARVRLSGTPVPVGGLIWPMVRHYDPEDFALPCTPQQCDPTNIPPITFWSPQEDDVVYGKFKGLVDYSRDSSRLGADLPQLIAAWDESGSADATPATALKEDQSGNCGDFWDTAGGEDPQQHGKQCSIPNWFYYAFKGTLSLTSNWGATVPAGQEKPSILTDRAVCDDGTRPLDAPSCTSPTLGDWVETAFGDIGTNMSDDMRALIHNEGFEGPYSDKLIESGPNKGERYGKALTVVVYLWDCAETFDQSAPAGQQWSLVLPSKGTDCSQVPRTGNAPTPDRVHLFTAASFTFYEGLVTSQAIQGYWGGAFGDARACQDCALNPLANTAFLVSDDPP